jgi:eukaryotic-like serine/threonine-protein kinase
MTAITPGERIGNYRIERVLGQGGLCCAYEAVHLVLPRRAVLRVMDVEAFDPAAVHMLREAYILEALQHPGVVRVYESGLLPDRRPWSAREHVQGPALGSVLGPGARVLDRADAAVLLRDIASVLEHAHERGVILCGLRPSRLVLTGRTRGAAVCFTDWSSARAHDAAPERFAGPAEARPFAAPELVAGAPIDERSDVFSLGVLAYRVLTGSVPFEDRAVATAPDGATFHVPTALRCPDVPRELAELVDQMLAHAPVERPSSVEAHDALAGIAEELARAAPVMPRIRRPRWTPPLSYNDRPEERAGRDPSAPVELMFFGDGIE